MLRNATAGGDLSGTEGTAMEARLQMSMDDFLHATLGRTGRRVFRLGLSGSYWPGEATLRRGIEAGMNYVFWYPWDWQMTRVLRDVGPADRERLVVVAGVGNLGTWAARHALEQTALRKLRTDYIDIFQIFWVGDGRLNPRTLDLLRRFKEEGKIRHIAISTHARRYAGELIRQGPLDVIMFRYNAAHRGAEQDIFPYLPTSQPGAVTYTATRWGKLLQRPRGWTARLPTAGDCYRFALSNPNVHVCLCAPRNAGQLAENLDAMEKGPLAPEDRDFMVQFGDVVHRQHSFFL